MYFSGSEEKVIVCREYGAHPSINYNEQNFAEEVLSFTGNKGTRSLMVFIIDIVQRSSVSICGSKAVNCTAVEMS